MTTRRAAQRWAVAGIAAIIAGALVVTLATTSQTTKTFVASTASIANPERGWVDWVELMDPATDVGEGLTDGITLVHGTVRLDAVRSAAIDPATLERLTTSLAAARAAGVKVILRFAYNEGPYPDTQPDASESQILAHLEQLTPVLAANVDIIYAVEAGFIGAWGEWHSSTHGLDADTSAKQRILAAILTAVPSTRDVLLRYPSDITALAAPSGAGANDGTPATRIGSHQDCFLASDPDDQGTFGREGAEPATEKAMIGSLSQAAAVGGETCNAEVPARTNCATALAEMQLMGFTFLNRDFEPNSLARLADEGCDEDITRRLGYRLELTSASIPRSMTLGTRSMPVSLKIRNTGFASLINERPAYLRLVGPGLSVTSPLSSDPRTWEAGTVTTINETLQIPVGAEAGQTYTLSLWMPDAAPGLQVNPAYSVQLANLGVWDPVAGDNVIATFTVPAS